MMARIADTRTPFVRWYGFQLLMASWLLLGSLGCERRNFYRDQADQEVNCIIQQTTEDPKYALAGVDVYMDQRSRYHSPYDPNRPPMPKDDPESNRFMKSVDGMKGYKGWEDDGVIENLANPDWEQQLPQYVPVKEDGTIVLNVDSALNLAYVNSTSYQRSLEELYLSALDVSAERFRFQTQFFGGNDTDIAAQGTGNSTPLTTRTDASFDRRFATAGTLATDFANSFVWQFSGPDTSSAFSFASFNLIQPLLRNGGRVVALETLTIAERTMLGNLRTFQRYRQGFYTDIAIGGGTGGPSRRGGFLGGTGLTGFTGQGAGGFGGVGGATNFGRGGGLAGGGAGGAAGGAAGFAGGGAQRLGGFIGLLQQRQEYFNNIANYDLQRRNFEEIQANFDAGLIDGTQVDQFRQTLQTQQAALIEEQVGLESSIRGFVSGSLSLPPEYPVELDDSFIRPFQLITPEMASLQNQVNLLQDQLGVSTQLSAEDLQIVASKAEQIEQAFTQYLTVIDADQQAMDAAVQQRMANLNEKDKLDFLGEIGLLTEQYADLKARLQVYAERLIAIRNNISVETIDNSRASLTIWRRDFSNWAQELALVHARFRLESITLQTTNLDLSTATEIALNNRVDLMNARSDLVNTWRLIAFNANRLQSDLTVSMNGNIQTTGNNPLNFSQDNSRLNASVQFDAPFTRLLERNNFRSALISYQRDRRNFIQAQDGLRNSIWATMKNLEVQERNLELDRQAVVLAIRRVDNTQLELNAPPQRDATTGQVQPRGPTLVQNLLSALNDLRTTQNAFMSRWLNYYGTRMRLMRDLGIMELDEEGRWIDTPIDWSLYTPEVSYQLPPELPQEWREGNFPEALPEGETAAAPSQQEPAVDLELNRPMQPIPSSVQGVSHPNTPAEGTPLYGTQPRQGLPGRQVLRSPASLGAPAANGARPSLRPMPGTTFGVLSEPAQMAEQPRFAPQR